jgi:hypothetical protein
VKSNTHASAETNQSKTPGRSARVKKSRHGRIVLIVAILMTATSVGLLPFGGKKSIGPQVAEAQNFSQRTIQGKVYENDSAVAGATVFLKNLKTRNVKSFTSTPDGAFRFAQVGMVDDYEVWAELGPKKSPVKTISSFDSRKQVEYELKLK